MKVLLVNTSERTGGAAVACNRLLEALNKQEGVTAKMLVRDKQTDNPHVIALSQPFYQKLCFLWERFVIWTNNLFSRKNLFTVSIANAGTDITRLPEFKEADIIHLHWVNQGMLSLKGIQKIIASGKPVVWTMHDMWPCTAICHHARTCTNYQSSCQNCSFLIHGGSKNDLSSRVFKRKQKIYRKANITLVACSEWLASLARKSALTVDQSICSIPNPINTSLFSPSDKQKARQQLALPVDKKLILFGSVKTTDKRKGIDYLIEACRLLQEKYPAMKEQVGIVVVGGKAEEVETLFPFKVYAMGYIAGEKQMAQLYNAVDLYVTPSLEENLPNTIMEALACGTPCVGFEIGGIPEMIDHHKNGYVAQYKSAQDLAEGIIWSLQDDVYPTLSKEAREKVIINYSEERVARRYLEVYERD